jgi:hypothetical protein
MLSPSAPPKPSSANRLGRSAQQALPVALIHPCARDDLGAILRPHVVLVQLDDGIDRVRRHETSLGEKRLERSSAQLDRRAWARMVMVVDVGHAGSR